MAARVDECFEVLGSSHFASEAKSRICSDGILARLESEHPVFKTLSSQLYHWRLRGGDSGCKEHSPGRERAISDCGSDRWRPRVSFPYTQLRPRDKNAACPPHRAEQFYFAPGFLLGWIA